jgi:transcriptional regulator with XRE-family HTH domain
MTTQNETIEYRYDECGLDDVVIHNMRVIVDDAGEETYYLPNITGLHKVIAAALINRRHGLLPKELRFLRTELGLTQGELGQLVKKDHQTIGRWERGETPIDENAEVVIRAHAAEALGIVREGGIDELARRCVPSATIEPIAIDASDPAHYRRLAA